MSTPLDTKINPKIFRQFNKYGRQFTIRTYPSPSVDTAEASVELGSPTDTVVMGFGPFNYSNRLVDGELIRKSDCYIIISGETLTIDGPETVNGAEVVLGSTTYKVVNRTQVPAGEDLTVIELQLRA